MASVRGPVFWRCFEAFLDFMVSPFWSAILVWQAPIWRCMVSWEVVRQGNTMFVAGFFAHVIADATSAALLQSLLGFALVFREGFGGAWLARQIISAHASLLWLSVMATILG